jgi:ATP adenylyltransferase
VATDDLWQRVVETTRRALARGALEPISTEQEVVAEGGIEFVVHVLARLAGKRRLTAAQRQSGTNPFLPPDRELWVADISDSHIAVLNRFNVLEHHLLIVTRDFEDQRQPLTLSDFAALGRCMAEVDGLGFYNGGEEAGASQAHKHLQLVPLPLGRGPASTPIDAVIDDDIPVDAPTRCAALSFAHALVRLDGSPIGEARASKMLELASDLLAVIGVRGADRPYNLLLTRRWMMAVPRRLEFFEGISVNALGFAGSLLVRDRSELAVIRKRGPMRVLESVAGQEISRRSGGRGRGRPP